MRVRVSYFGPCRLHAGCDGEALEVPAPATVRGVLDAACARHPALAAVRASLLAAVDQEFAKPDAPVLEDAEVVVMPPLSGG